MGTMTIKSQKLLEIDEWDEDNDYNLCQRQDGVPNLWHLLKVVYVLQNLVISCKNRLFKQRRMAHYRHKNGLCSNPTKTRNENKRSPAPVPAKRPKLAS